MIIKPIIIKFRIKIKQEPRRVKDDNLLKDSKSFLFHSNVTGVVKILFPPLQSVL